MIWVISACLAIPVALLHLAGVPLIWSVILAAVVLLAVVALGRREIKGPTAVLATAAALLVAAAVVAVIHSGSAAARGPAVVTFGMGTYSSYGTPSFSVDAMNDGGSAGTVHQVTVQFVNERTAQVITSVTEQAGVTVPAGQGQALTYAAPAAVVNTAIEDRQVGVTVTGWH